MEATYTCDVIHDASGLVFRLNLTSAEVQLINNDENYAKQVAEKYYQLYLSGVVSANTERSQESEEEEREEDRKDQVPEKRRVMTSEDEELLIRLVSEWPPLFNHKLPLKDRGREKVRSLWQEVIAELNVDINVENVAKKWKNMRDSFVRVRSNIKKKLASGSSAEEKLQAEKIKNNHKHYDLMLFLEDTFSDKKTASNLEDTSLVEYADSEPLATPSTSRGQSSTSSTSELSVADRCFLETIQKLPKTQVMTPTQSFCMRLADGLDKLPPRVRNELQVEFLSRLTEMENRYLYNE